MAGATIVMKDLSARSLFERQPTGFPLSTIHPSNITFLAHMFFDTLEESVGYLDVVHRDSILVRDGLCMSSVFSCKVDGK